MVLLYPREILAAWFERRAPNISPTQRQLVNLLADTVFFASLMKEESEAVRVPSCTMSKVLQV